MNGNQLKERIHDAYLVAWLIFWGTLASIILAVQWMLGWNRRLP